MQSQLPSAPSLKSMGRRRDEGPPPALRGTSPSPSEGGEPPTGHSLIWLDKLFFLLSSPYLLKSLMLSVQQSQLICSTSPPYLLKSLTLSIQYPHVICSTIPAYLFNIPTLFIKVPHVIYSISPPYLFKSPTLSVQHPHLIYYIGTLLQHLSLCHYVLKRISVSICHYVILS